MADAWALQQIGNYKNGKILLWSWISRGLISMEQLASWHFNQNLEEAQQFLESASGELRKLADLDELPEPHEPGDASGVAKAETTVMSGEVTSLWSITDPENPQAAPIVLPQWFVGPIDKAILIWKQESAIWKQRKEKRLEQGHDQLTPKMQEAYEQWMSDTARSIILNKKTKTQASAVGVLNEPSIHTCVQIPPDSYVILASDGLWEKVSEEEAAAIAAAALRVDRTREQGAGMAAKALVSEARSRWIQEGGDVDDITAVVVHLGGLIERR
eukprot:g24327.t1